MSSACLGSASEALLGGARTLGKGGAPGVVSEQRYGCISTYNLNLEQRLACTYAN